MKKVARSEINLFFVLLDTLLTSPRNTWKTLWGFKDTLHVFSKVTCIRFYKMQTMQTILLASIEWQVTSAPQLRRRFYFNFLTHRQLSLHHTSLWFVCKLNASNSYLRQVWRYSHLLCIKIASERSKLSSQSYFKRIHENHEINTDTWLPCRLFSTCDIVRLL